MKLAGVDTTAGFARPPNVPARAGPRSAQASSLAPGFRLHCAAPKKPTTPRNLTTIAIVQVTIQLTTSKKPCSHLVAHVALHEDVSRHEAQDLVGRHAGI